MSIFGGVPKSLNYLHFTNSVATKGTIVSASIRWSHFKSLILNLNIVPVHTLKLRTFFKHSPKSSTDDTSLIAIATHTPWLVKGLERSDIILVSISVILVLLMNVTVFVLVETWIFNWTWNMVDVAELGYISLYLDYNLGLIAVSKELIGFGDCRLWLVVDEDGLLLSYGWWLLIVLKCATPVLFNQNFWHISLIFIHLYLFFTVPDRSFSPLTSIFFVCSNIVSIGKWCLPISIIVFD